jgi:predicted N-acetyltransferase YhbS
MAETAERGPVNVWLRPGQPDDAEICGPICYDAFSAIASAHGFPSDYPSAEVATALLLDRLRHPGVYSVVAEAGGSAVGSAFMDERSSIAGIGPVTVAPGVQNQGIGRLLMQDVLRRAAEQRAPGVRLLQTSYNNRSLTAPARPMRISKRSSAPLPSSWVPGSSCRPPTLTFSTGASPAACA